MKLYYAAVEVAEKPLQLRVDRALPKLGLESNANKFTISEINRMRVLRCYSISQAIKRQCDGLIYEHQHIVMILDIRVNSV